jgi:4-diphosphocytidyl-2-C-methyl-D-erythritol kinase
VPAARVELAPAKVNLTLRVLGRRPDGYHDLESLVVFARVGDALAFTPARTLALAVRGPTAAASGALDDNLVVKAARALAQTCAGLKLGHFVLSKRLPVAAGLGGGSADAAAALRLLARANGMALDDPRVTEAARATGADVPVCLDARPRLMRGIGDVLSAPLELPRLAAVLVNPRVAVPTKMVFQALHRHPEVRGGEAAEPRRITPPPPSSPASFEGLASRGCLRMTELTAMLAENGNDLEAPAISLQPVIAEVLAALRALPGCALARMSGSGATCFGLFETMRAATSAARTLRGDHPSWWIRATRLG